MLLATIGDKELRVANIVDTSNGPRDSRVLVFSGEQAPNRLFIFGGEKACMVKSDGEAQEVATHRSLRDEEYWNSRVVDCDSGVALVYESGILFLNESLEVAWQRPKLFNDFFLECGAGALRFSRDDVDNWAISAATGELIDERSPQ